MLNALLKHFTGNKYHSPQELLSIGDVVEMSYRSRYVYGVVVSPEDYKRARGVRPAFGTPVRTMGGYDFTTRARKVNPQQELERVTVSCNRKIEMLPEGEREGVEKERDAITSFLREVGNLVLTLC